jgi:hypothetical protein
VGDLELERDRFESVAAEVDEEEQPEVVPQLPIDAVVIEEVAEVVEDARRDAVENVRGMSGDQRSLPPRAGACGGAHVVDRVECHVRAPVRRDEDGVRLEPPIACVSDGGRSPPPRSANATPARSVPAAYSRA